MPGLALRARRFGDVVLQATIDRSGTLVDLEVVSGPGLGLEEAALRAVRTWRFAPATLDGSPVAVRWRLVVSFREQR
jgi:protein TonB